MRKSLHYFFIRFVCIGIVAGLVACDKHEEHHQELIITLASVKSIPVISYGYAPYYIKEKENDEWKSFDYIIDFEHEEGYEYRLRILREKWHNGEIMDAGIYRYHLIEILSKEKKESENIPDQSLFVRIASKKSRNGDYYVSLGYSIEEIGEIINFDYEEGYEYQIEILARFLGHKAEPRYVYTCDKVYNKEKMDSEWVPESGR